MSTLPNSVGVDVEVSGPGATPHVDLPAIIAGALLSAALAFLLSTFGSAVGLSMVSPYEGAGVSATMFVVAIGVWMIWIAVSCSMAGAYVAGRLRRRTADATPHEVEVRDGFHGLAVWALATLFGAWLAAGATASMATAGKDLMGDAAHGMRELLDKPDVRARLDAATDKLVRAAAGQGSPRDIGGIVARSAAAGELRADDRQYLIDDVAARSGRTEEQAAQAVDQAYAQAQDLAREARHAADLARRRAVLVAFVTAASLLAAGAGAWWAGTVGGLHREQCTDFSHITRWSR